MSSSDAKKDSKRAKDDQSGESAEGQQPETASLGGHLTDSVEQERHSVDAGSQEGLSQEPQVTSVAVEKIDGGLADNPLKSTDDWARLLLSEVDQSTCVDGFRANFDRFMKKFREENTKVASQQSIEVLKKENTKVALQQSIDTLKQGNTKVTWQQSNEVLKQENTKVTSEQSIEVLKQENTKVTSEQSIEVLKEENTKLALQNEMLKKEITKAALQNEVLGKIKTKLALQNEALGKEKTDLMKELQSLIMQNREKASDGLTQDQELQFLKQQARQYEEKLRILDAEKCHLEMRKQQLDHSSSTHTKGTGTSGEHSGKQDQTTDKTEASQ